MAPDRKALADAGRKRLEEFRKAKAAGKAGGVSSPDQASKSAPSQPPAPQPEAVQAPPQPSAANDSNGSSVTWTVATSNPFGQTTPAPKPHPASPVAPGSSPPSSSSSWLNSLPKPVPFMVGPDPPTSTSPEPEPGPTTTPINTPSSAPHTAHPNGTAAAPAAISDAHSPPVSASDAVHAASPTAPHDSMPQTSASTLWPSSPQPQYDSATTSSFLPTDPVPWSSYGTDTGAQGSALSGASGDSATPTPLQTALPHRRTTEEVSIGGAVDAAAPAASTTHTGSGYSSHQWPPAVSEPTTGSSGWPTQGHDGSGEAGSGTLDLHPAPTLHNGFPASTSTTGTQPYDSATAWWLGSGAGAAPAQQVATDTTKEDAGAAFAWPTLTPATTADTPATTQLQSAPPDTALTYLSQPGTSEQHVSTMGQASSGVTSHSAYTAWDTHAASAYSAAPTSTTAAESTLTPGSTGQALADPGALPTTQGYASLADQYLPTSSSTFTTASATAGHSGYSALSDQYLSAAQQPTVAAPSASQSYGALADQYLPPGGSVATAEQPTQAAISSSATQPAAGSQLDSSQQPAEVPTQAGIPAEQQSLAWGSPAVGAGSAFSHPQGADSQPQGDYTSSLSQWQQGGYGAYGAGYGGSTTAQWPYTSTGGYDSQQQPSGYGQGYPSGTQGAGGYSAAGADGLLPWQQTDSATAQPAASWPVVPPVWGAAQPADTAATAYSQWQPAAAWPPAYSQPQPAATPAAPSQPADTASTAGPSAAATPTVPAVSAPASADAQNATTDNTLAAAFAHFIDDDEPRSATQQKSETPKEGGKKSRFGWLFGTPKTPYSGAPGQGAEPQTSHAAGTGDAAQTDATSAAAAGTGATSPDASHSGWAAGAAVAPTSTSGAAGDRASPSGADTPAGTTAAFSDNTAAALSALYNGTGTAAGGLFAAYPGLDNYGIGMGQAEAAVASVDSTSGGALYSSTAGDAVSAAPAPWQAEQDDVKPWKVNKPASTSGRSVAATEEDNPLSKPPAWLTGASDDGNPLSKPPSWLTGTADNSDLSKPPAWLVDNSYEDSRAQPAVKATTPPSQPEVTLKPVQPPSPPASQAEEPAALPEPLTDAAHAATANGVADASTSAVTHGTNHAQASSKPPVTPSRRLAAPYSLTSYAQQPGGSTGAHGQPGQPSFLDSYLDNLLRSSTPPPKEGSTAPTTAAPSVIGDHAGAETAVEVHGSETTDHEYFRPQSRGIPRVASQPNSTQFSVLQQHIEDLTSEKLELQRGLNNAVRAQQALEDENATLVERLNTQAKTIDTLNSKLERYELELHAQVLAVEGMAAEREAAKVAHQEAMERASALASESVALEQNYLNAKSSALKLQREVEELQTQLVKQEKQLLSVKRDHASANEDLAKLTVEKRTLFVRLKQTESRLHKMMDELGVNHKAREAILAGLAPIRAESVEAGAQCDILDPAQVSQMAAEREHAMAMLSAAQSDAESVREALRDTESRLRAATAQLAELQLQRDQQQEQLEQLERQQRESPSPSGGWARGYSGTPRSARADTSLSASGDGVGAVSTALWQVPVRDPPSASITERALQTGKPVSTPAAVLMDTAGRSLPPQLLQPLALLSRWLPAGPITASSPAGAIVEEHLRAAAAVHELLGQFEDEFVTALETADRLTVENQLLRASKEELQRSLQPANQRPELSLSANLEHLGHLPASTSMTTLAVHDGVAHEQPRQQHLFSPGAVDMDLSTGMSAAVVDSPVRLGGVGPGAFSPVQHAVNEDGVVDSVPGVSHGVYQQGPLSHAHGVDSGGGGEYDPGRAMGIYNNSDGGVHDEVRSSSGSVTHGDLKVQGSVTMSHQSEILPLSADQLSEMNGGVGVDGGAGGSAGKRGWLGFLFSRQSNRSKKRVRNELL